MNAPVETSFVAPYYQLNKKVLFNSSKKYLQDESNGLYVYFPEGSFHIKNEGDNGNSIAEISL